MSLIDIFRKAFLEGYATSDLNITIMLVCTAITALIALYICVIYKMVNRNAFYDRSFQLSLFGLSIITSMVILTIQSNIVISLGMVGALSIVRFRTAIKNPMDLVFLFWSIATGIICGAGLYFIALPLTLILGIAILLSDEVPGVSRNRILVLDGSYPYDEAQTMGIVKKYAKWYNVRTESVHNDAVNLIIEVRRVKDSPALIRELRQTGAFHDVSLLVQEGTID